MVDLEATKEANKKAEKGIQESNANRDAQKVVITVLKQYKAELEELKHLKDIDEFYSEYQDFKISQKELINELQVNQDGYSSAIQAQNNRS